MRKLISRKQVREQCLYSYAQIQRLEDAGKFPRRVRLGNGPRSRVAWVESEIEAWLAERIDRRGIPPTSST